MSRVSVNLIIWLRRLIYKSVLRYPDKSSIKELKRKQTAKKRHDSHRKQYPDYHIYRLGYEIVKS